MEALLGFVCCFSVFAGIIWMGIRFLTGITEYIKSATSHKSHGALAGKNRAGAGVSTRSIGSASQLGQKVQLKYINAEGEHRRAFVDANTVQWRGNRVKVDLWNNRGTMNLAYERIKNPEVLGLSSTNPVTEPKPLPPALEQEEDGPPILHPKAFILGDPSGPELLYVRRDGNRGVIYFEPTSIEIVGNRVNLSPKGLTRRYAIALDQIINPEILESDEGEEGPPILEPKDTVIGDPSGKELQYRRTDGASGYIFFEPDSVEIVGNRVNLSPKGIDIRYAIAMNKVINPGILIPEQTPEPEVIYAPPKPEPVASPYEEGIRIILDEIPLDSFEAVQVMRLIKPELSPFEIFDALIDERETLLQGYTNNRAEDIQEDLQNAGCTVSLQTIGPNTGTAIAEPPPQPKVMEEPEPLVIESAPRISRPPTENEFSKIRSLGFLGNVDDYTFQDIKWLIEATPIDVNARDVVGNPLVFGVHSTRILGLLMDRGADIHAKSDNGSSILNSMITSAGIYKMLLQFGADFNARNKTGWTPLIYAAIQGEYETAKILIEHGADIHVKDVYGETALQIAENQVWDGNDDRQRKARKGCEKIAALLREHGAK